MCARKESKNETRACLLDACKITHEQKRTERFRQNTGWNTSDIRDLLDSKLSSDSPPRAVAWHGFLVAVNFPLIVVHNRSVCTWLHERECTGEGKSTYCIRANFISPAGLFFPPFPSLICFLRSLSLHIYFSESFPTRKSLFFLYIKKYIALYVFYFRSTWRNENLKKILGVMLMCWIIFCHHVIRRWHYHVTCVVANQKLAEVVWAW